MRPLIETNEDPSRPLRTPEWGVLTFDKFGSTDPSIIGKEYKDDVFGVEIGPESEVDAIKIVSDSFPLGYHVVTTRSPFKGYVKGPFLIAPYYAFPFVNAFANDNPNLPLGLYRAQVVLWKAPQYCIEPKLRAPRAYTIKVSDVANWWTGKYFFFPTFGRKNIRLLLTNGNNGLAADLDVYPVSTNFQHSDLVNPDIQNYAGASNLSHLNHWQPLRYYNGMRSSEWVMNMRQVPLNLAANAGNTASTEYTAVQSFLRPDWFGVNLETRGAGDPGGKMIMGLEVYDD